MPRGRPPKPGGKSIWIPPELLVLVEALKGKDFEKAAIEFARWTKDFSDPLDSSNKPDVN